VLLFPLLLDTKIADGINPSQFGYTAFPIEGELIMGKFTTIKIAKEEAKEAVSLTGAKNNTEAIRLLLEEKRRLEKRRRLLAKAGRIAIEYVRPKDRGKR